MTPPATLTFPQLLDAVPAPRGRRLGRGLLLVGIMLVLGGGAAVVLPAHELRLPLLPATARPWVVMAGVALLVGGVDTSAVAASGASPLDRLLQLRHVRTDGDVPGARAFGRGLVAVVTCVLTLGVLPLLATLVSGREPWGRSWLDRLSGLVVLDVGRGRDVVARPVRRAELDGRLSPVGPVGPAVVPVGAAWVGVAPPHGQMSVPVRVSTHRFRIRFNEGPEQWLSGTALVGRAPDLTQPDPDVMLVPVEDPGRSVSKTHLRLRADAEGVWVEDLGSTNGSQLTTAQGRTVPLTAGCPVLAGPGARVVFGDCSLEVGSQERP